MRLLFLDLESSGRCLENDRIIETGYALVDTEQDQHVPLITKSSFLYDDTYPVLKETIPINGISNEILIEFGNDPCKELVDLDYFCFDNEVEYVVSHNASRFDRPLLENELKRNAINPSFLKTCKWIDTLEDIPYHSKVSSRKLEHLAGSHGFVPLFPHRALYDVLTLFKIFIQYPIQSILDYRARPWGVVQALVGYEDRQKAKDNGYRWQEIDDKVYDKSWVKKIKLDELEKEEEKCPFPIKLLK
jgi:DNA polymerase-3 subunit epsilon